MCTKRFRPLTTLKFALAGSTMKAGDNFSLVPSFRMLAWSVAKRGSPSRA